MDKSDLYPHLCSFYYSRPDSTSDQSEPPLQTIFLLAYLFSLTASNIIDYGLSCHLVIYDNTYYMH